MLVAEPNNLLPVALSVLRWVPDARLDLFIGLPDSPNVRLYCSRDRPLDPQSLEALAERGVEVLYTPSWEDDHYQKYLAAVLADERRPTCHRLHILRDAAKAVFRSAM